MQQHSRFPVLPPHGTNILVATFRGVMPCTSQRLSGCCTLNYNFGVVRCTVSFGDFVRQPMITTYGMV